MTRLDEIKDQVKTLYGDRFWRRCESKELAGRLGSRRFCTGRAQTPVGPVAINFVAVHRQLQQVKDMTLLPPLAMMDPTPPHTVAPLSHLPHPQLSTIP